MTAPTATQTGRRPAPPLTAPIACGRCGSYVAPTQAGHDAHEQFHADLDRLKTRVRQLRAQVHQLETHTEI